MKLKMNNILPERIRFFLITYFFFILFALLDKVFFMLFHWQQSAEAGFSECLHVLWHGLPMDLSMAGYFMIIPGLVLLLSLYFTAYLKSFLRVYFAIACFFQALIVIPDIELYSYWGFRMDKTVLTYIVSPKEALASVPFWVTLLVTLITFGWAYVQYSILNRYALKHFPEHPARHKIRSTIITIVLLACMILPIRGGFSTATMNASRVYFSDNIYLNHAALNPVFNMLLSLEQTEKFDKQYRFFPEEEAENIFEQLMKQETDTFPVLLNTDKPNIVFILLESFGHSVVESLGGIENVAPNLNKLTEEGVFFTHMYANSFRTDRGVVSAVGGYPAQPTMSILKYPVKVQNLNSIPKTLKQNGYTTSMLYGGDLNFAGIRSFFLTQGVTDITVDKDFPAKNLISKWGAPDHITFPYFGEQIKQEENRPYMKMFLTLSSHEPFDVPMKRFSDPYLNSVAYTDSCLGVFIDELKAGKDWENTLVVLVPDHNMRYPATESYYTPGRHHIFMLWLGGAVEKPCVIHRYCSQADIAATLLAQLGLDYSGFPFSKNILNQSVTEFSFYDYPNGFGMLSPAGRVAYDCDANKILFAEGESADTLLNQGKAYLQCLYNDIQSK